MWCGWWFLFCVMIVWYDCWVRWGRCCVWCYVFVCCICFLVGLCWMWCIVFCWYCWLVEMWIFVWCRSCCGIWLSCGRCWICVYLGVWSLVVGYWNWCFWWCSLVCCFWGRSIILVIGWWVWWGWCVCCWIGLVEVWGWCCLGCCCCLWGFFWILGCVYYNCMKYCVFVMNVWSC